MKLILNLIKHRPLAWIIPLFLLSRFAFLLFVSIEWMSYDFGEELFRGALARDFMEGLKMPLMDYRQAAYESGLFVVSLLAVSFFKLLGPTFFALKCVPFLLSLITLIFWYLLLFRYANRRTACLFSLLFIFSSAPFIRNTLSAIGDHPETMAFTAAGLFLFFKIIQESSHPRTMLWAGLLGLISGLAVWFDYAFATVLFTFVLFFLINPSAYLKKKQLGCFLVSFLIGFFPWLLMNAASGFPGFHIHGLSIWDNFSLKNFLIGFLDFERSAVFYLIRSFVPAQWGETLRGSFFAAVSVFIFLIVLFYAAKPGRRLLSRNSPVCFFWIYLAVYLGISQAWYFTASDYHVVLTHPFVFALAAYAVDFLLRPNGPPVEKRIGKTVFGVMLVLGMASPAGLLSFQQAGRIFSMHGYSYELIPRLEPCRREFYCLGPFNRVFEQVSQDEQLKMASAYAQILVMWHVDDYENYEDEIRLIPHVMPEKVMRFFFYYLGHYTRQETDSLERALKEIEFLKEKKPAYYKIARQGMEDRLRVFDGHWPMEEVQEPAWANPVAQRLYAKILDL